MTEYDDPWKEALELFFEQFMQLCFADVHAAIDWSLPATMRDKELQQLFPESQVGKRFVDKLFEVLLLNGQVGLILIHVEVQSQKDVDFSRRMYVYNHRIAERYGQEVLSLAVLGDTNAKWRPNQFRRSLLGCELEFRFPMVKLLDFLAEVDILEQSDNLFAPIVLAHLMTVTTADKPVERCQWKTGLVRGLYLRGLTGQQIRQLIRVIDWMMDLPPELAHQFKSDLELFEQEKNMPYVTSFERIAREEGRVAGQIQLLQQILQLEETSADELRKLELSALETLRDELRKQFQEQSR